MLAGDIEEGTKGHLPNNLFYTVGADVGVNRNLTVAFDLFGQRCVGVIEFIGSDRNADLGSMPLLDRPKRPGVHETAAHQIAAPALQITPTSAQPRS